MYALHGSERTEVEQLSAWVSLIAALLSIGSASVGYWRSAEGNSATPDASLSGFVDRHDGLIVVVVTMLALGWFADWALGAFGLSATPVWILVVMVIGVTAVGLIGEDGPDP